MGNQKKGGKALLIGIIGAVIVLAAVLGIVLTQCAPQQEGNTVPTTAAAEEVPTYQLYWNLDRAEYDGKSEAGMSSRMPESDGLFHIRMFLDGEEVIVKTADRKIINKLDTMSLMGLEFDGDGLISDVLDIDELPLETPGWSFYVQSVGGKTIKLNSSESLVGIEILLEGDENTGIYDMTGMSGPVGCEAEPMTYDRVYPVVDMGGNVTHVFLYSRPNFMLTHEGECQHCKETVTWYEWTRTDTLPSKTGHYQLMADPVEVTQVSLASDVKICLDLNGHEVHGKKDARIISLHNPGTSLALMDTSEAQTGRMVGHSEASPQGGVVWVRYGQFHLYSGTLDGSDMVSRLNGTVVQVQKNSFFYMYGGEIIGGTAAPQKNATTGKYTYGLGGAVQSAGTIRMYGGVIRDGKAPAVYYYSNGKLTMARGMGGNLFLASGSVTEIAGGKILNGFAGNVGGNIMMDGTAELTISGGEISGGRLEGRIAGKNGANIYVPGKATVTMTGGTVSGGRSPTGGGGNFYLAGTAKLTNATVVGGYAGQRGGNIYMTGTGNLTVDRGSVIADGVCGGTEAGHGGGNIVMVSDNCRLLMVGGTVRDGFAEGTVGEDGALLGGDGGNINMNRGTAILRGGYIVDGRANGNGGGIYVGWNSKSLTLEQSIRIYDNEVTDIVRSANTAAGKSQILMHGWAGNPADKGAPVVGRLEGTSGAVVITTADGTALDAAEAAKVESANPILPLVAADGSIVLSEPYLGEPDHTHCLCAGKLSGHSCADTGFVSVNAETFQLCWANGKLAGSLNMCLTEDVTISSEYAVSGNELNLCLHGHTIHMVDEARLTSNGVSGVLNIADCTGKGKILAENGSQSSFLYTYKGDINIYDGTVDGSDLGVGLGPCRVGYAGDTFTLYGGTVIGSKNANNGGSFYCSVGGTINIKGGTVRDGVASSTGGGNIYLNHNDAVLNISGGTVSGGKATNTATGSGLGGNIHVIKGKVNMTGGTVTGGSAKGKTDTDEPAGVTGGVYMAYNAGALTLSGSAKITGNTGSDIWLTSKASYVVTLNGWDGNGGKSLVIGKTAAAVGTQLVGAAKEADIEKFTPYNSDLVLKLSGDKLVLATPFVHDQCICAGKVADHTCRSISFSEVASQAGFDALFDDAATLEESVSIVLTAPITLTKEYKLGGKTLDLCLNGQTVTMSGNGRLTANGNGGVLNITDCGSGRIVAASGTTQSFLYTYNGQLNLYAGTVDGSAIQQTTASSGGKSGGIVNVYQSADTFNMYGGTLIGAKIYRGGSVYTYRGTFNMYGGTITGGHAGVGGGVATDYGNFYMYGGTVTGNKAETNGAAVFLGYNSSTTLTLSGDAAIFGNEGAETVYMGQKTASLNTLILDGWNGNGGNGTISLTSRSGAAGSVVVKAKEGSLTEDDVYSFAYTDTAMKLALSGGKIVLEEIVYHDHCICNGVADHTHSSLTFTELTGEEFLALFGTDGKLTADATVCLTSGVELTKEYTLNGYTLNLCLNGQTVTMSGNGRLTANGVSGVLNITACDGGKIEAAEGCRTSILYTYKGEMSIYGGTVDASRCASGTGGAVRVGYAGDSFTLYGGTLIGSQKGTTGGTVYCGVAGTVEIKGGTVRDGVATGAGGGNIYVTHNDAVLTVSGGTVSGGKATGTEAATGLGGNIHVVKGTVNLTGGTVTGGTAEGLPKEGAAEPVSGGIYIPWNCKAVNLSGSAKVCGNEGTDIYLGGNTTNFITLGDWQGNGSDALVLYKLDSKGGDKLAAASGYTLTAADATKFAYAADATVVLGDGILTYKEAHKHCVCNGKVSGNESHTCATVRYSELSGEEFLTLFDENGALKNDASVCLTSGVELTGEYNLSGHTLNLCLNGQTVAVSGSGRLTSNGGTGVLNITDCAGIGKIEAAEGTTAGFIYLYNGNVNLFGGTVDASKLTTTSNGGAVYVNTDGSVFTMYGGTVKAAKKAKYGGAVYLSKGDMVIHGGTVYGGETERGGAVFAQDKLASFTMTGGLISGGSAQYGGCVGCNYSKFTMTGGTITGGSATDSGAGVNIHYNVSVTVDISGTAKITGNNGADIHLGQKNNQFVTLGADWAGNGEKAMVISRGTESAGAVIVSPASGSLTDSDLAKFAYLNTAYSLAVSGGKIVLAQ